MFQLYPDNFYLEHNYTVIMYTRANLKNVIIVKSGALIKRSPFWKDPCYPCNTCPSLARSGPKFFLLIIECRHGDYNNCCKYYYVGYCALWNSFVVAVTGDDTRTWGPPFANSESTYFLSINRNKKVNLPRSSFITNYVFCLQVLRVSIIISTECSTWH